MMEKTINKLYYLLKKNIKIKKLKKKKKTRKIKLK